MKGVISAGHPLTVEAGIRAFRQGGNAFDAAISAIFASFVCESPLTSLGGGGFLMAHTRDGKTYLYDFFTTVPGKGRKEDKDLDFFSVDIEFAGATQSLHIGKGSVAIPGILSGLEEVYRRHATLPIDVLVRPSLDYAKEGIIFNKRQASFLDILYPVLTHTEEGRQIYTYKGSLIKAGDVIRHDALARTLEKIGEEGMESYFRGEFKEKLLDAFSRGSKISERDLDEYETMIREPLSISFKEGYEIKTNPTPSSGGSLVALSLKLIEGFDIKKFGHNTYRSLKRIYETMKIVDLARWEDFCHRIHDDGSEFILSSENLDNYRGMFSRPLPENPGNTTHISVIDEMGNAVSTTTTTGIGCGYFIPDTGIMMNNMLGEEDVNPHGFHTQPPGQRLSSMMAPTIVLKQARPFAVLGSGGSKRIRNAIFQVLLNLLEFNMNVYYAVGAPRIHWDGSLLQVEPGILEETLSTLETDGIPINRWEETHMYFGGVNLVTASSEELNGAGDPRRGGDARVFHDKKG